MERTADNVMARLQGRYTFDKAFNHNALDKIDRGNFDLLYLTYWKQFIDAGIHVALPDHRVSGIRSHFKWDGGCGKPPTPEIIEMLNQFDALNVPSRILFDIFLSHHPAIFHTPHGVDADLFSPIPSARKISPQGELVLGWAGSRSNHPGKRGLDDFLMPALGGSTV